ncbi:energy transducer TonB [Hymenobacter yonginensis]|uniref:Energy transducer TonB n=1 Tax=Hymenobacter yonginensis TaxID=748197 RepID=A0ABY7PTY4_9BACT|nr:energy transducer TonB [Hymenobacter yonginensis]WBO86090.1 energy transducer TonB [Hymenobacter yonginensis]
MTRTVLLSFLLAFYPLLSHGQGSPVATPAATRPLFDADSSRIYTFVEQSPTVVLEGGWSALQDTLSRRVRKRLGASAQSMSGRIIVSIVIGPRGGVFEKKVVQGLNPQADAAALAALDNLPRFIPGKQNGQRVAVRKSLLVQLPPRP